MLVNGLVGTATYNHHRSKLQKTRTTTGTSRVLLYASCMINTTSTCKLQQVRMSTWVQTVTVEGKDAANSYQMQVAYTRVEDQLGGMW